MRGPGPALSRRAVLLGASAGAAAGLTGCGEDEQQTSERPERIRYGDEPDQFGQLYRASGSTPARGTVVLIHGGYWQAPFTLTLMPPMARVLATDGWDVWNVEYRRIGTGGGWPATFADVAAAVDRVADLDVDTSEVVTVGHSAGGTLAVWAASRTDRTPGGAPAVTIGRAASLGGLLALQQGVFQGLGGPAISQVMGGPPELVPRHYELGDPVRRARPDTRTLVLVAEQDQTVPPDQAEAYVAAVDRVGGRAELVRVPGDHASLVQPDSPAVRRLRRWLTRLAG